MTEKRFKADKYYFEIWDNDEFLLSFDQTVDLLNQLNDENEQLQSELNECNRIKTKRTKRMKNQRKALNDMQEALWGYKGDIKSLKRENEQLKTIRSDLISELDIVQNELNIAIDKGFAPSKSYKNYLASKKTEYDKFWENKIKTHNNRLNGVRE